VWGITKFESGLQLLHKMEDNANACSWLVITVKTAIAK